jgi:predicted kinase
VSVECIVFVGLPASGKSTFYRQRFAATHTHISKDLLPKSANKGVRQARDLRAALGAGQSVVVDNTNPAVADRGEVISVARQLGARVIGYYFAATARDCVGRNRGREGAARVPPVAIFTAAKRLVVPTRAEGFDELWQVTIGADGGFDVEGMG